jgi:hypothetical protein
MGRAVALMAASLAVTVVAGIASGSSSHRPLRAADGSAALVTAQSRSTSALNSAQNTVRLGFVATPADGVALVGIEASLYREDIGSAVAFDPVRFSTGSSAQLALERGEVDAAYLDPGQAVAAWQATHEQVRVIAGAASAEGRAAVLLVATATFVVRHPTWLRGLLTAQLQATRLLGRRHVTGRKLAAAELTVLGTPTSTGQFARAVAGITFGADPPQASVLAQARQAAMTGRLKAVGSLEAMYDLVPVDELLASASVGPEPTPSSGLTAAIPGQGGAGRTGERPSSQATNRAVAGDIYTIDGLASNGLGGPATRAAIGTPAGVLVNGGNVYIANGDGNQVLEVAGADHTQWGIAMIKGDVYVIAGSPAGKAGSSVNGTPRADSLLNDPVSVAMDDAGDLFIADFGSDLVLELTASARPWGDMAEPAADALYRVAGVDGKAGDGRDGKPATSSDLDGPAGVFIGGNAGGNLYIADSGNNRIQLVPQRTGTTRGQQTTAYDAYTVAGSAAGVAGSSGNGGAATAAKLDAPEDVTVDDAGDLLIADTANCRIQEVAGRSGIQWRSISMRAGDVYTVAGRNAQSCTNGGDAKPAIDSNLSYPAGVADAAGNLFIADTESNVVQEVAGRTGTHYGQSMTDGDVYAVAGDTTAGSSGNGGPAVSAELDGPSEVATDNAGDLYVADTGNLEIRKTSASSPYDITDAAGSGFTTATIGDGGPAIDAALSSPDGMISDARGDLYVVDEGNYRVQEIAASSHTEFGTPMIAGDTYTVAGSAHGVPGDSGNGVRATSALLSAPTSVALDKAGDVYITDSVNNRVVEVAASSHTQFGIHMNAGDAYTVAGSATGSAGDAGDGGPATSALLNLPAGIAVDKTGNLFIADTVNNRIQEVPAASGPQFGIDMTAGDMYTVAGSADGAYGGSGDGGLGTSALLADPLGISVDSHGDVYIADSYNNRIQELAASPGVQWGQSMQTGYIYTVAGSATGAYGDKGDGGRAASAMLNDPSDVTADSAGDLYIADSLNNQIREVAVANSTQWGQSMVAGDLYTVVGATAGTAGPGCTTGNPAGGCPARSALLDLPGNVGTDRAGDLFITELVANTVLEVAATSTSPFPVYPG